jgi:hypothetical protein
MKPAKELTLTPTRALACTVAEESSIVLATSGSV